MTEFFLLSALGFALFVAVKFLTFRPAEEEPSDEAQPR